MILISGRQVARSARPRTFLRNRLPKQGVLGTSRASQKTVLHRRDPLQNRHLHLSNGLTACGPRSSDSFVGSSSMYL